MDKPLNGRPRGKQRQRPPAAIDRMMQGMQAAFSVIHKACDGNPIEMMNVLGSLCEATLRNGFNDPRHRLETCESFVDALLSRFENPVCQKEE